MKKCEYCHEMLEADMRFCPNCGAPAPEAPVTAEIAAQPITPAAEKKTNGFATAALVCGILSIVLCCCCLSPILAILAIVFGAVALPKIKREGSAGKEMAIIAIILGGVVLLFMLVGGIFSAVTGDFTYDYDLDLPDSYDAPYEFYEEFEFGMPEFDTILPHTGKI